MAPEQTEAGRDANDIQPYDIEGYEWNRVRGDDVGEGTLLPGHCHEVYELREKAGYTLDIEQTYYVAVVVDDGDIDFYPQFTTDRSQVNDAMRERVSAERISDDAEYWTLEPTEE